MTATAPVPAAPPGVDDVSDPTGAWGTAESRKRLEPHEGLISLLSDNWPRVDDGLQITGGGAVAVDTVTLRTTADAFARAEDDLAEVGMRLGALQNMLLTLRDQEWDTVSAASVLGTRIQEVRTEADGIASALREAAAVYELVEIDVGLRAAALAGDGFAAAALGARRDALAAQYPEAWSAALGAEFGRGIMWPGELVRQGTQWGVGIGAAVSDPGSIWAGTVVGLGTVAGVAFVGLAGTGRLGRGARLTGAAGLVTVTAVEPRGVPGAAPGVAPGAAAAAAGGVGQAAATSWRSPGTVAPQSLASAAQRIPGDAESRVRIEKYTMPDGSRQAVVYIAGMQAGDVAGGDDPWDNESNLQLYAGQTSDSYAATEAALAAAGVEPGDAVHVVAFSQGGMIGAHLALEGGYDVQTLVSLGSPVDADVGPDTLSVTVRHTDDPVAGLAGGGHVEAVGAPGSFVAERVYDPDPDTADELLPAHRLTAYAETAALVDASGDPRLDGVRAVFDGLARAESVEVSEYAAARG